MYEIETLFFFFLNLYIYQKAFILAFNTRILDYKFKRLFFSQKPVLNTSFEDFWWTKINQTLWYEEFNAFNVKLKWVLIADWDILTFNGIFDNLIINHGVFIMAFCAMAFLPITITLFAGGGAEPAPPPRPFRWGRYGNTELLTDGVLDVINNSFINDFSEVWYLNVFVCSYLITPKKGY